LTAYLGLFFTALLAATLLPFYSEVLFAGLLVEGYEPFALWAWATAGNTLGSAVNWALARYFLRFEDRRWFPFREKNLGRAQAWFQRYGVWSLLMAWAPVGGDALTFVAGLMRVRFWLFLLLVGIGKGARYAVVLWMVQGAGRAAGN
jgi:membrane protein YqaA with SNARE-associated domain